MRTVFRSAEAEPLPREAITAGFAGLAKKFSMDWELYDPKEKVRTVIAVPKFGHCLNDLLHRVQIGAIPIDVVAVVSNHDTFQRDRRVFRAGIYRDIHAVSAITLGRPCGGPVFSVFEDVERLRLWSRE